VALKRIKVHIHIVLKYFWQALRSGHVRWCWVSRFKYGNVHVRPIHIFNNV